MSKARRGFYDPTKPFGEEIRTIIEETHPPKAVPEIKVRRVGKRYAVTEAAGYWDGLEKMTTTDGTGTKGSLIWRMKAFEDSGNDPFAMTVDDLYEHNYEPYKLQSHLIVQEENRKAILGCIRSLKALCIKFGWVSPAGTPLSIVIDGGETAVCDTVDGLEFSVTATGYARPGDVLEAHAKDGDLLIGIASNGIHSNGLTFARHGLFGELRVKLYDDMGGDATIGEELTKPTRIYLQALRELKRDLGEGVTGKVHITGGAFSKLKELSKGRVSYVISADHSLKPQAVFRYIYENLKVPDKEMLTRFNCGIGYIVAVDKEVAEDAVALLRRHFDADIVGRVVGGESGIKISSPFSRELVLLPANKVQVTQSGFE
jgi:phosphoribosylformylglycinamidine cyclo-ligase